MQPKTIAAGASLAIAALLGGTLAVVTVASNNKDEPDCGGGQVAGGSLGGAFTLIDESGKTVTDIDIITGPTLVYFGYTFCPDVCPMDASRNATAVDLLEEQGRMATPVMISIDPARDTPEVMGLFVDNFHDRMIGLTGSDEQVATASRAYKTFYQKQDGDPDLYMVDHSTFTYLAFPGRGVVDFFRNGDSAEEVAARTSCFMDAFG